MAVAGDHRSAGRMRFCAAAVGRPGDKRGGAPGGAARPKQAVRASGSFCGARRARSASGWQHPSAWRGPRPWRLSALHLPALGRRCLNLGTKLGRRRAARCGRMPDRAMQLPIAVCTSTPSRIAECRTVAVEAFAGVVSRIERARRFVRCRLSNSAASCAPPVPTSNPRKNPWSSPLLISRRSSPSSPAF